jgi:hypothetical protein
MSSSLTAVVLLSSPLDEVEATITSAANSSGKHIFFAAAQMSFSRVGRKPETSRATANIGFAKGVGSSIDFSKRWTSLMSYSGPKRHIQRKFTISLQHLKKYGILTKILSVVYGQLTRNEDKVK